MALTIGSGTFTNGSTSVAGVTFTSGGASFISSGTLLGVGVSPIDRQVEAIAATTSTITLREAWGGTTGVKQFTAAYTTEGLRDAVDAARGFSEQLATRATATTTDMQTATNDVKISTPLKVKQAIDFHTGTAATRDVGESAGNLMQVGAFGLGGLSSVLSDYDIARPAGFYVYSAIATPSPGGGSRATINVIDTDGSGFQFAGRSINNEFAVRSVTVSAKEGWVNLYHTGNTTVDVNGFIKEASPIVRLYKDRIEEVMQPQGAIFEKLDIGDYKITGTIGFSQSGWYIETPKDANGNIKFITEYSQDENGTLFIKTFNPVGSGWKPEKGEPVDITDGRWIDIRLEPRSNELEEAP